MTKALLGAPNANISDSSLRLHIELNQISFQASTLLLLGIFQLV